MKEGFKNKQIISINTFGGQKQIQGKWELNLKGHSLHWSPEQYRVYGYEPNELTLNDEYFIINTTHPSDIGRITSIINEAIKKHTGYKFKRRIIKKNGTLGFVETEASIIRAKNGIPHKIIGVTHNVMGQSESGIYDYNDPAFFKHFYSSYRKAISAEIYKWTYDNDLTKDLCQEIFLKAWHNMSKYDSSKGELYTWLIQISKNHCKDYLRSKYFRYQQITQQYNYKAEDISENEICNVEHLLIKELLFRLPLDQREIMELLFVQGYTQTDVAKLKSMPLGTIKSKSRAAIKVLRDFLSAPQNAEAKEELMFC